MIKKFSSPKMRNREFVFTPKIEYKLVAERSEENQNSLTFPFWCSRQESNLHRKYRKLEFYPLNYESTVSNNTTNLAILQGCITCITSYHNCHLKTIISIWKILIFMKKK